MDIQVGKWKGKLDLVKDGNIIRVKTHPDAYVKEKIIKALEDVKWMGGKPPNWIREKAYYEAPVTSRNLFHLQYYDAHAPNPYGQYKKPLEDFGLKPRYSRLKNKILDPLPHQILMANHWWTREVCHIAADMRVGKTLPALSVAERLQTYTWIIAPMTAVAGIKLELYNWDIQLDPEIMTYNEMVSILKKGELTPPKVIIFDEAHYLKNWSTERTQAAFHVTEEMRRIYDEPWIMGMSGTPVPKDPTDIWAQAEVIRPGYIAEPSAKKLKERLAIIEYKENETGGQYPHLVAWRDREDICNACGQDKSLHMPWEHAFEPCKNEVQLFSERLGGFSIRFKKSDCMKLPEKIMEVIELKPSRQVLKYAKIIRESGKMPAVIMNELMQLSAGFYYEYVPDETKWVKCPRCNGSQLVEDNDGNCTVQCPKCEPIHGGYVHPEKRVAIRVECPKDEVFENLLDEHEETMRFVAFGGFTGSIDRMADICLKKGWKVIQVDGRGFNFFNCDFKDNADALFKFGSKENYQEKLAYVGHPGSGGTGVSLSASSIIVNWNNSFDGGARMQSIERGSDLNMDMTRGCKIVDLVQLQVDKYVLANLENKEKLQNVTLGDINDEM